MRSSTPTSVPTSISTPARRPLTSRSGGPAVVLVALLAAACAKAPSGHTCASHGDCPSGTTCQAGMCQEGMALEIGAPPDPAVTRGTVAVAVTVTGLEPPAVLLLVDDRVVATLTAPFTYQLDTASLAEGSHALAAEADLGGRSFRSPARTLLVDRTAPGAPVVAAGITNAVNPVPVSGTAEAGATVTVYEGSTALGTGVAGAAGAWSAGVALGEGPHALIATATDAAGNASSSSPAASVVVDRTAPAAPTVNAATTNAANPVPISGTAEPGSTVALHESGVQIASGVVTGAGGTWNTAVPLAQGAHALTATATDAAGNPSAPSAEVSLVVDRNAALPPTVVAMVTNAADPVPVSGTAEVGSTVTLVEGGTTLATGVGVTSAGTWTARVALAEGTHALAATSTDAGGNASALSAAASVVVDRTAPGAPAVTAKVTNAADPVPVSGTAEAGAQVAVHEGATLLGSGFVAGGGGAWSGAVALAAGTHALRATATDAAGNASPSSATANVVVDRTAPAAPTVAAAIARAANPVPVSGTAEAGASVAVHEGGALLGAGFVASGSGAWGGAVTLAEGAHSLAATATDAAGNVSALSAPASVAVDRTAPGAPTVASATTRAANPVTVTGTAEPGASVTLYEGGTALASNVVAAAGGGWSAAVALAEGTHALTATAADAAGNVSAFSAPGSVAIDRTPPAAPSVTARATNASNPVTVSGTAEAGSIVTLYEGATVLAPAVVASAGGSWSAAVSLSEAAHALTATAADAAGNVSAPGAAASVLVDRTAPSVVSPTVPAANATGVWSRDPIVVAFSEAIRAETLTAQTVTVRAGGTDVALGASTLSADGRTLTLTPNPAALPAVPSTVVATLSSAITDLAGNPLPPVTWSWSLPGWLAPAPPLLPDGAGSVAYSAVLGPDDAVRVAYAMPPPRMLAYQRTAAGAWVAGGSPDPSALFSISDYQLGVDSAGRMTLAFLSSSQVRVTQQSGASWVTLSTNLNVNAANAASGVRVAVDALDRPVVLWAEGGALHAKRWDGSAWTTVLDGLSFSSGAYALAIGPANAVAVAVSGRVYVNGSQLDGYQVDTSTAVALAYDGSGTPIVAYVPPGTATVQVVRPGNPPVSWYAPLGGAMGTAASSPSLVYRATGPSGQQLLVSYNESATGELAVKVLGWNGTAWSSIASDIGTPAAGFYGSSRLMVNGAGVVAVGWGEQHFSVPTFVTRIYNR